MSSFIFLLLLGCNTSRKTITNLETNEDLQHFFLKEDFKIIDNITYNLQGKEIQVSGTIIFKNGGKIVNGTLIGNHTKIIASQKANLFNDIIIKGKWNVSEGYIYWFTDGKDAIKNFKALCNLIEMEACCILDKMYPIATPTSNEYYNTTKSIRIKGVQRHKSGLILKTKHTLSNAYFRSSLGNNISLKNMTLVTDDFLNRVKPKGYDYCFGWSYYCSVDRVSKPKMQFFKMESCDVLGAISFRYSSSSQNTTPNEMLQTGIDSIIVSNNKIEESVSLIELSNGRYDISLIQNNEIKNIYGPTFYYPIGDLTEPFSPTKLSKLRKSFIFRNNHVYNDNLVFSLGEGYMSSFIVKGNVILVENNIFENLINDNDKIETVPFYTSSLGNTEIFRNKVINCLGRGVDKDVSGSNSFLRIRGSRNVYVRENIFELNQSALIKLGFLKDDKSDISEIDISKFRFALVSANLNATDFDAEYEFKNNKFFVAFLPDYSILSRSKIIFDSNTINIDYLSLADKTYWNSTGNKHNGCLFNFRDKTKNGRLIFDNNSISIRSSNTPILTITKDVDDNKDFDFVSYKNNIFDFNGEISIAFPRAKLIEANNKHVNWGCISFNESTTNSLDRTIGKLALVSTVNNYIASKTGPIHLKFNGSSTIIAKNNMDSIINLMNIRFQDVYTNTDLREGPIIIEIYAKFIKNDGRFTYENYQIGIGDFSSLYFINNLNKVEQTSPVWTVRIPKFRHVLLKTDGNLSDHPLIVTSTFKGESIDNNGFLLISNTNEIKSFEVRLEIKEKGKISRNDSRLLNHILETK